MAITQKSRWDDTGQEPPAGEARYQAGEQPIAEYDNWFNKSVVDDIAALNAWLDNLGITKVYIDVEANMPASGKTTELFIATDTNKIYRGTGSGWQELTVDWNAILNKPSAYPPEAHQHDDSDLLSIDWSKILNKPSTFPPDQHNHDASEIVSGVLSVDIIPLLPRSKISDFFNAPFWNNIPDAPQRLEDMAPRATITEYISPSSGTIANATDRDPQTYVEYRSGSAGAVNAVQFDLGSVYPIIVFADLGVLGVGTWGAARADIAVSADGSSWTTIFTTGNIWSSTERRFYANRIMPIDAQYVMFKAGIGGGSIGGDTGALRIYRVIIGRVF